MQREYRLFLFSVGDDLGGLGGVGGQGIAAGLRADGRAWVLGLDQRDSLFASTLCDQVVLKPNCDETSESYLSFWIDLIGAHNIDLIVPGISIDMVFLANHRKVIEATGAKIVLNEARLMDLSEDKLKFAKDYAQLGLPTIPTVSNGVDWAGACEALGKPPFLIKPSVGEGSVGVQKLRDQMDFEYWTKRGEGDFLCQKIIGQDDLEFTVGIFGTGQGTYLGPITFRRKLTRAGNTGEAEVCNISEIARVTQIIARHYQPVGPTNLQFRMQDEQAYLLEINPRFSSSTSLRQLFGFNEATMCLDFFLNGKMPTPPEIRQGFAQRHSADLVKYARNSV